MTTNGESKSSNLLIGLALGAIYRETAGLVMFLLVLLVRPSGLFGRN